MKDKLRELAERWKIYGSHMTGHECAAELLSLLDAEGDGGVGGDVPKLFSGDLEVLASLGFPKTAERIRAVLATHPARSGVVSDEAVSVVAKMIADRVGNGMREKYEETAKQIVEHFTKGERHER